MSQHYYEHFGAMLRGHGIENFTARELAPVGRRVGAAVLQAPPCDLWSNIIPTLRVAEWLRGYFAKPVIVNSGYRDRIYNRAVGSTDASQHIRFTALDIRVPGVTSDEIVRVLEAHEDRDRLGIGRYSTFVHIDTRGQRARW
jgi:uncharacterized protein YcbK (DUF882 family)